ncbi:MAG: histidinol dehydrogenase [Candidatus Saganbacteria bacterium]|nr:histidinol dehydrogenase [Candidatus Saganbacteria bacterium]
MLKILQKKELEAFLTGLRKSQSYFDHPEEETVKTILKNVEREKDQAVVNYTLQFDGVEMSTKELRVTKAEVEKAYKKMSKQYLGVLKTAIHKITTFHRIQKPDEFFEPLPLDAVVGQRSIPVESAGVYVPGGSAAYPSSVLMNVIPAKVAGVKRIVMVTPPKKVQGKAVIDPHILVAAAEVGVDEIYKVGGAQAIGALTFGTATIPKVDMIVGPGNLYVTLAKKLVYGLVGIDKLAGPSDVLIIADESAEPAFIAADLLAQAEHDPHSSVILVTPYPKIADKVQKEIVKQFQKLKRKAIIQKVLKENSAICLVASIKECIDVANLVAPEHLELFVSSPQRILPDIKNAGAVFMGPYSPVVLGDYMAGPNHVLPTSGGARFASPLTVYDFVKKQSFIGYSKPALKAEWEATRLFAELEGLDGHARSIDIRFK